MAIIKVVTNVNWGGARWVFDYIVERLAQRLAGTALEERLISALNSGLAYLDLTDVTNADRFLLRDGVRDIADTLQASGPGALKSPEFYDTLLKKLRELQEDLSR